MMLIRNRSILEQEFESSLVRRLQVPQRRSARQRRSMLDIEATRGAAGGHSSHLDECRQAFTIKNDCASEWKADFPAFSHC